MLIGTVIGVMVIPGLYYLFARIGDGRKLIKDEHDEPLSELFERDDRTESIEHPKPSGQPSGDATDQPEAGAES